MTWWHLLAVILLMSIMTMNVKSEPNIDYIRKKRLQAISGTQPSRQTKQELETEWLEAEASRSKRRAIDQAARDLRVRPLTQRMKWISS